MNKTSMAKSRRSTRTYLTALNKLSDFKEIQHNALPLEGKIYVLGRSHACKQKGDHLGEMGAECQNWQMIHASAWRDCCDVQNVQPK